METARKNPFERQLDAAFTTTYETYGQAYEELRSSIRVDRELASQLFIALKKMEQSQKTATNQDIEAARERHLRLERRLAALEMQVVSLANIMACEVARLLGGGLIRGIEFDFNPPQSDEAWKNVRELSPGKQPLFIGIPGKTDEARIRFEAKYGFFVQDLDTGEEDFVDEFLKLRTAFLKALQRVGGLKR